PGAGVAGGRRPGAQPRWRTAGRVAVPDRGRAAPAADGAATGVRPAVVRRAGAPGAVLPPHRLPIHCARPWRRTTPDERQRAPRRAAVAAMGRSYIGLAGILRADC